MSMNRRNFLQLSAATAAAVLSTELQAGMSAAFPVIDCHTHFYDPSRPQGVPWPGRDSSLYRTVLPADLRRQPQHLPVTGTIVVEASSWLEDNDWLLELGVWRTFGAAGTFHLTGRVPLDSRSHGEQVEQPVFLSLGWSR